jgi:GNAT superfamily N-acetyltransferase
MQDMLVKLYDLPNPAVALETMSRQGVVIRPALNLEKPRILEWMRVTFPVWVAEAESAFCRLPVSCFIAVCDNQILGFACYDVTCQNYFGPSGVQTSAHGRGIGRALLLATLYAQRAQGYAYAIIGGVGPREFYEKSVGATLIEGSDPGIYDKALFGRRPGSR